MKIPLYLIVINEFLAKREREERSGGGDRGLPYHRSRADTPASQFTGFVRRSLYTPDVISPNNSQKFGVRVTISDQKVDAESRAL
jgi:hypothetical protein